MTDQELSEKIARFVGIKDLCVSNICPVYRFLMPDDSRHTSIPDFPHDLNALFKWVVPKLAGLTITKDMDGYFVEVDTHEDTEAKSGEELAMTICLAVEKLIAEAKP